MQSGTNTIRHILLAALIFQSAGCALVTDSNPESAVNPTKWVGTFRDSVAELDLLDRDVPEMFRPLGRFPAWRQIDDASAARDPRSQEAKLGIARLDQLAGRRDQAEKSFQEVLRDDPANPLAHSAMGMYYASEQRWTEAILYLEHAVSLAPNDRHIRHQYAITLARSGRHKNALKEFAITVGEAEAYYNIGYLLWQQGRAPEAKKAFQKSKELSPRLEEPGIMLAKLETGQSDLLDADPPRANEQTVIRVQADDNQKSKTSHAEWATDSGDETNVQ